MNIRKELEALRDRNRNIALCCENNSRALTFHTFADNLDSIIQRIPEGWEMRPRHPNLEMRMAGERWIDYCASEGEHPETKSGWVAMWDACEAGYEHSN